MALKMWLDTLTDTKHFVRHDGIREWGLYHYMTHREQLAFTNAVRANLQWAFDVTLLNNWSAGRIYIVTGSQGKHSFEYEACGIFK